MSLHVYAVPLTAYFSGDYETILEKLAGEFGKTGMVLTKDGISEPNIPSRDELTVRKLRLEVTPWIKNLQLHLHEEFGVDASWDESGGLRRSTNMSHSSHAGMLDWAERGGAKLTAGVRELMKANIFVPVPFVGTVKYDGPIDEEAVFLGSSIALDELIQSLGGAIERNEEWRALLASKSEIVEGDLLEISSARSTVNQWAQICEVSLGQRVPIVTD